MVLPNRQNLSGNDNDSYKSVKCRSENRACISGFCLGPSPANRAITENPTSSSPFNQSALNSFHFTQDPFSRVLRYILTKSSFFSNRSQAFRFSVFSTVIFVFPSMVFLRKCFGVLLPPVPSD